MTIPTRDLVLAKLHASVPAERRAAVLADLDRYAGDTPEGRVRVQLAILKLSSGDATEVRLWMDTALRDFRDVLAAAEYPRQHALGFTGMSRLPDAEREAVLAADRTQWLAWLGE